MFSECEWGEDAAMRNCERVLKRQYTQIKETHDRIRNLEKKAA